MIFNLNLITFFIIVISSSSFADDTTLDLECALKHTLCNPSLTRPCCNSEDKCNQTWPDNIYRCVGDIILWGLGKFCELDEDCHEITHAKCSKDQKCICREGNVRINAWTCAPKLGQFCWKDELCATENAACIGGECKCTAHYFSWLNNQCQRKILGASCLGNDECSKHVRFAKCSNERVCTCSSNTTEVNPAYCAPIIGGFCWENDECVTANSECIENRCNCPEETEYNPIERRCDLKIIVKATLIINILCSEANGCICYVGHPERMYPCSSTDNVRCINNASCVVKNSLCIDGYCQCSPQYLFEVNQCIPRYLNGSCQYDRDCNQIENAVCSINDVCICDNNYNKYNETSCKPVLDGVCTDDIDCIAVNSICIENKCECKPNTIRYNKDACTIPQLGIQCKTPRDCKGVLSSQCSSNGKCECIPTYEEYNMTACAPLLGRTCSTHQLCAVAHSSCVDNKCHCNFGYTRYKNDKCAPHHIGMECEKDSDCNLLLNSKCIDHVCSCHNKYIPLNSTVCAPPLNESCKIGQQCATGNSLCINKKCQCKLEYSQTDDRCLRINRFFQMSCDVDSDCGSIKHSHCSPKKQCVCKPNYVLLEIGFCIGLIGETCDLDDECISHNTVCVDHKCQCNQGQYAVSLYECDRMTLGSTCWKNEDCSASIKNSECSPYKICVCPENYYVINEFECAPVLFKECSSNDDCRFNASACIENECKCKPGFSPVSESQCKPIGYMYSCDTVLDCGDPWHYQCHIDKKCRCKRHHFSINRSTCVPLLKGYCWKDSQCLVNNSVCIDYHCQCKEKFVAISDNFCISESNSAIHFPLND